ncbi:RNA polymerase sigma factor [Pseudobacter ginsenosidimutans]|uniref:RNA polymerase sigma-70 factor (ECF subfamily) n=1 Tax=Pseudobacter ginsenosidimutans TaxID=661488 RepID=A0A4V2EZ67_9BACT|nr:sigma-70 family RNA polymerase sigma factor [Pseudobacter ginsenosidimutans]QEC45165.1 sigma-70 family RNA polymerase sigma factor [Pseudobacter ginsenosidimutans]RZS65430.1 RNA polymerase sigma-70 factor (ECF subfamily) [Pseudobacter ginsenosidimutans]
MTSNGSHTDNILFQRIAQGDESAFEELFLRYVPRISPVIIQITGTEAMLKDIVQEVFLQLWINRERLPEVREPDNWIFKMVYNRSYSWVRKQVVRDRHQQSAIGEQEASGWEDPEAWFSFEETALILQQAIATLSPQARRIFHLKETGSKIQEIAAEAGISVDGVKKSLYRSAQQIKAYLAERGISLPLFLLVWWLEK